MSQSWEVYIVPVSTGFHLFLQGNSQGNSALFLGGVSRQTVLVDLLHEQGFEATQSSVSRDLKQLGVTKLGAVYTPPEPEAEDDLDQTMFSEFVREIQTAGANLTVIKTAIGAAQRVAVCLDRSGWPEIIGTVSGDDTIFVATASMAGQNRLVARLRERTHH